jgi:deazaflavin-dependent oxidoreductase (nitroreductase family)
LTERTIDPDLGKERNGYLVTTGRTSGLPRETEIWFIAGDGAIYLFSGMHNHKDWFRNFQQTPRVRFRIRDTWFEGTASVPDLAPVDRARLDRRFTAKYYGERMTDEQEWTHTATIVAITLDS